MSIKVNPSILLIAAGTLFTVAFAVSLVLLPLLLLSLPFFHIEAWCFEVCKALIKKIEAQQ